MLRKSPFFDFLNRNPEKVFKQLLEDGVEEDDYINWNGYLLPADYGDAEAEYRAIRNSAAIFDVTPLQKIRIKGQDSGAFLDRLLTRRVSDLPTMRATYVVFCNENGTIKDDAILYKFSSDDYLFLPSDIDHTSYFEALASAWNINAISFSACGDDWSGIAIQGQHSASSLVAMGLTDVEQLKPFGVKDYDVDGALVRIARVGFTADLGYECWFAPDSVSAIQERITAARTRLDIDLPGYGLSALEACRLEGGFVVAGWDFSTELDPDPALERTPYEVGLGWLVNLHAADFVGRDALLAQKKDGFRHTFRRVSFGRQVDDTSGAKIYAEDDGTPIGFIACASWSWGMQKTIGNASILPEYANLKSGWIESGDQRINVRLGRGAFVDFARRNQVPAPVARLNS